MNAFPTSIQPDSTNDKPHNHQPDIQPRQPNLLPIAGVLSVVEEEPQRTGEAVRKPRREEGGDEAEQRAE